MRRYIRSLVIPGDGRTRRDARQRTRRVLPVLLALAACAVLLFRPAGAQPGTPQLDLALSFSTDGGKTWSSDFPFLEKPGVVKVRVTWANARPAGETDVYTTNLFCAQTDFASANRGSQNWSGAPAFYQRLAQYWAGSTATGFDYDLDLRARPDGVMGTENRWDEKAKKFVNAPLPSCPALADGTYRFTVTVGYWLKKVQPNVRVNGTGDFFVTIGRSAPPSPPNVGGAGGGRKPATAAPAELPLDTQQADLGRGDYEQPAAAMELIASAGAKLDRLGALSAAQPGTEVRWLLKGVPAGEYHVGLVLSTPQPVYLDGEPVRFASTRKPGTFEGKWVAEHLTAVSVAVREGAELRVACNASGYVGRVALYKARPARGPIDLRPAAEPVPHDKLRATAAIQMPSDRAARATATCTVTNVLTRPVSVRVTGRVLNYFQETAARFSEQVVLQPRVPFEKSIPFAWGDTDRYRLVVDVSAGEGVSASAVADALTDAAHATRGSAWLSGTWEFTPVSGLPELAPPAADAKWGPARVPGVAPGVGGEVHAGWYRRRFTVPAWMPGDRRLLRFERVDYEATVLLNGREIARHMGWQAGFDADVTDLLKPGENELLVGARNGVAALTPEERARGGAINHSRKGLWPGASGRCSLGDVLFLSSPGARVEQVATRPSLRKKTLGLEVHLAGLAPGAAFRLRNTVLFEGRPVLRFPEAEVRPGTARVSFSQAWPEPILWGEGKPNLLRLDTELVDVAGRRVDLVSTRFGFREMWAENGRLLLNGVTTNFRAYAMNSDWGWTERMQLTDIRRRVREGRHYLGTMERHIYGWRNHLDVADEEGMPLVRGVTAEAGATQFKIESDEFWKNTEALARECVRQLQNHPSVVEWYISNEFSECAPDAALATRRLVSVRDAVVSVDPTRIVEAGCDLDLRGALDIISTHYPVDIGGLRDQSTYLPDAALWRVRGTPFRKEMRVPAGQVKRVANVHGESPFVWGVKPILVNETGWNIFYAPINGFTVIAGDDAFRGPAAVEECHLQANTWFMAGHRDAEASVITPWHHHFSGAIARTLPPVDIFPFTRTSRWYAGTPVAWGVDIFHDTGTAESLTFRWQLVEGEKVLNIGSRKLDLPAYGLSRQEVAFQAPAAAAERAAELRLALLDARGKSVVEKRFPARIYPKRPLRVPAGTRLGLFDPSGKSAAALQSLGLKPAAVANPTAEALAGLDVLVVGEGAGADPALVSAGEAVRAFVEGGGRILCLQQERTDPKWLPLAGQPVPGQTASMVFARAPHHPVLQGITAEDLRFWHPDHLVARMAFPKPATGALTILDCGNAQVGLDLSVLMEARLGKGTVLLSQLVFADRAGASPVSDRLLENMLRYLATAPPSPPTLGGIEGGPVRAVVTPGGAFDLALKQIGARLDPVADAGSPPSPPKVGGEGGAAGALVAEAGAAWTPALTDAVRRTLEGGGRVLLHGAGPAHRDLLKALSGREVKIVSATPPEFSGRMVLTGGDPITDGLSNQELFWRRQPETEDTRSCFLSDSFLVDKLALYAYEGDGVEPLGYPAALARVSVGKGVLYLDAIRWDTPVNALRDRADRIGSTLLQNLGVVLAPREVAAKLTGLECEPIDIRAHLNRALADDVPQDGKGGWSDQGPDADLREMPTGRQILAGVPFDVATPNSCLVLASKYTTPGAPEAVTGIQIGRKADALYFLQSSAWTGRGLHATYRIRYADGKTVEIPLVGGANYRDWAATNPADPFAFDTGTFTEVGWTGKSKLFPKVSVYVMQWVNSRPEVAVDSFDFVSAMNGVPILLGVTAGVRPAGDSPPSIPPNIGGKGGDTEKARALDEQAIAAIKAGDRAKAMVLLKDAVVADATYVPARMRLAGILEDAGRPAEAEAELRAVVRVQPDHLDAYLVLGRVLEAGKRWADALAVYRQSLKVNPNQPMVMQAIERVEKSAR